MFVRLLKICFLLFGRRGAGSTSSLGDYGIVSDMLLLKPSLFVTAASFLVVGESFLVLLHHKELAKYVPGISEQTLNVLPHLPLWADTSALAFAILLSLHHLGEWKAGQRREKLPKALEGLVQSIRPERLARIGPGAACRTACMTSGTRKKEKPNKLVRRTDH
jgi:hypothetical protein